MISRKTTFATIFLSAIAALFWTCAPVFGQASQRGASSRGINSFGARRGAAVGASRPAYNRPATASLDGGAGVQGSYNSTGPTYNAGLYTPSLGSFAPYAGSYAPYAGSNTPYVGPYAPYAAAADMAAWNNLAYPGSGPMLGTESMPGARPSVRPRLDVEERTVTASNRELQAIRSAIVKHIAQAAERPFSDQWYASRSLTPLKTQSGSAWTSSGWEEVRNWAGLNAGPIAYGFRPDEIGLIFAYRNQERLGRAVDLRGSALELAQLSTLAKAESPGLSLGVFAEVPPIDQPVQSLLHLVLDKSGSISGHHYNLATDVVMPVQGALDPSSQRVAWQVGDDVMQAGLENLTREVTQAILFRSDGWTQPWILMRVAPSTSAAPGVAPAAK